MRWNVCVKCGKLHQAEIEGVVLKAYEPVFEELQDWSKAMDSC